MHSARVCPVGERPFRTEDLATVLTCHSQGVTPVPSGGDEPVCNEESAALTRQLGFVEADGAITVLDDDLLLANGLGWSPDGRTLYSVDTLAETIYRRDYGADATGDRFPFVVGALFDGMTVDSRGNLWTAVRGAGEVRCFGPSSHHRPRT